ncbi:NAD-dependent deacetylase [Pseudooceanicola batsensis HTCC2597]|uniref:NAD-dependent protein deacylase n=1 Tax=Pseudooceanicola batsensis (strain ATCC BAA-863 / DSM 15984 / KCTC 12145 / HTCC2597) TaxID=252305 RepID=A3TTC1_PSEBH|nr:NAD-dependent deacylase [Pseudooceanicola batsensis]EAQ04898.1 NAD-dependent deacetylase [Pseudooceanicola batsensis HTCC2597]
MDNIVILTGAGISTESGMGTFRGAGGLWENRRVEDVATPEGFARDPEMVHRFYNMRRQKAASVRPNAAHEALARLQREHPGKVTLVTQNVDALHEAGGSDSVIHMHGRLAGALCAACDHRWEAPDEMHPGFPCPACAAPHARPDVVWFGEMPYHMEEIFDALSTCTLFAAIGTSGQVYPAAGFVQEAFRAGAHTVEINLEPSAVVSDFAETRFGPATQTVPAWVDEVLGR